jgi:hypothetical protein
VNTTKRQHWDLYAVAIVILVSGLAWVEAPASTLLFAGLILVCPVMMIVMMRGMHSGDAFDHDASHDRRHHHTANRTDDPHRAGRPPRRNGACHRSGPC